MARRLMAVEQITMEQAEVLHQVQSVTKAHINFILDRQRHIEDLDNQGRIYVISVSEAFRNLDQAVLTIFNYPPR